MPERPYLLYRTILVCLQKQEKILFIYQYLLPVCRWKRGKDREILQKEGKNVLEFVAIKSLNKSELEIPGVQYKKHLS